MLAQRAGGFHAATHPQSLLETSHPGLGFPQVTDGDCACQISCVSRIRETVERENLGELTRDGEFKTERVRRREDKKEG